MRMLTAWSNVDVKTAPTLKPIALADVREHLNLETADAPDSYLNLLIDAAIARVDGGKEGIGYAMLRQSWTITLDDFGWSYPITLPGWPVVAITSIKYRNEDNEETTLAATAYKLITERTLAAVWPIDAGGEWDTWPEGITARPGHVVVEYTLGAAAVADVPADLKIALLMMVSQWYMAREGLVSQALSEVKGGGVEAILDKYRWGRTGS